MSLKIDYDADALYLKLTAHKVIRTREAMNGDLLDFDAEGNVVGIEILGVKRRFENAGEITPEMVLSAVMSQAMDLRVAASA